ncbi:hypothetical protein [uncultured Nostoc sp.]
MENTSLSCLPHGAERLSLDIEAVTKAAQPSYANTSQDEDIGI